MGASLSEDQEKLLCSFPSIVLFLDDDEAGREVAKSIAARLVHRTFVKVVHPTPGKQPDELSVEEMKSILTSL